MNGIDKKNDFKHVMRMRRIGRCIQIILGLSLIIGLNILASKYYFKKDLTENRSYSLNPESISYIKTIKTPIEIFVTIPPASSQPETAEIYLMVSRLLREYEYVSRQNGNPTITVEYIDPCKETQRTHEIASRFGTQKDNLIVLKSGENYRQIGISDLFIIKGNEIEEFKGEQVFTSAILNVANLQKDKIYFLTGHGEMRINDVDPLRGLSLATHLLRTHNIDVDSLELNKIDEIPEDANLLIISSPQTALLPEEINKLSKYLSKNNGRLLVFLDPIHEHGLEDLFYDWGILVDDMLVLDSSNDFKANNGDLILRSFADHPISKFFAENKLPILAGLSRPVRPDIASRDDPKRTVVPLISGSKTSWGERNYQSFQGMKFDPEQDLNGPVTIAMLAERRVSSQLGINIPGSRIIVFGNSFISNNRINALGNRMFFQNAINWALDRNDLLNIPPKALKKFQLTLSQKDLLHIALGMLATPGGIACLGLLIFAIRKR